MITLIRSFVGTQKVSQQVWQWQPWTQRGAPALRQIPAFMEIRTKKMNKVAKKLMNFENTENIRKVQNNAGYGKYSL